MATKVTNEGQVTIPKPVLEHLGIGPGSEVAFRCAGDGTVVLEKAEEAPPLDPDRFDKVVGILPPSPSTDEIMAMLRGEPEYGQVTIPRWVQDQIGGPGSEVAFRRAADGTIVLEKAKAAAPLDPDRFAKLRGIAGPGPSTDEIMALLRGD